MRTLVVVALLVCLVVPDAFARGGRGGGRGGRGGGAPQPSANPGGGGGGRNSNSRARDQQKKRTEQERKDARLRSVEAARLLYAKQERDQTWDAEAAARFEAALRAILGTADR